ncbi:hypothetical protein G6N05_05890 [Flavobacterium sp. F372]|jgi:hypothetical protein|uniref:DUF4595 domain-containing protein n=1 Tax=Flavobacterium bernardetii TaxID=2813823 RepID=A0ABR7IZS6_9FLAO|nr:hypothetical protein [Flavobacterium bernardetii]MBC5835296.1 hypothetical protein [Flavobacterium bernardetii]NHF69641.1 hypothetical protein [Flavobacterium bernardetii]
MVKIRLIIFILCVSQTIVAQFRERFDDDSFIFLQQSDSIYVTNKVKSRTTYFISYGENRWKNKFEFYKDGKTKAISFPTETIYALTTGFSYDSLGKVTQVKDVYVKNKDSKYYKNFVFGDKELEAVFNLKPKQQIVTYELFYSEDTISKVARKNENGKIITESTYKNNGLNHVFFDKDKYPSNFVCNYLPKNTYQHLIASYEYEKSFQKHVEKFEYVFDENNVFIKEINQVHDSYYKNEKLEPIIYKYKLEYNLQGLLVKLSKQGVVYEYHYEYY